jgi:ribonuclease E
VQKDPAEATSVATPKAPAGDATPTEDGEGAGAAATTTGAPRRRSRGGRGRGRGGAGRSTTGTSDAAARLDAGDDEAPKDSTAETQREDALPDTGETEAKPTGTRSRSRRGRRGSGATKKAAAVASTEPETKEAAKPARSRSRSVEEQVAAGGPTRGLRSTRSRTGRVGGGRRRREDVIIPPRITDKVMVITEHGDRDQIAVLEENALVQHYVTRTGARSMVGNVYLARVQNVLPGMEAAFLDIGRGRNGVLYAGEVNYSPEDLEGPAPRIEQVLKNGQPVMVQVTKDPMGGKGARLTAQISMPGRYLVFVPNANVSGISRRLPDEERKRLKTIMKKVRPEGHGVIVRTAAEGASEEALTADLERLIREWDDIQKRSKKAKAPAELYEEPELTVRVVRDLFTDEEFKELVTDSPRVHEKVMAYVRDIAPDLEPKVHLHTGKLPVFEEYRVVEQIHKALDKKVWLPSGGYLFIERTEAMTIVDVNTGKSVGKTNLEETVVNTNLEAAKETARQLRLRDIGGIIVIDFIDMLLEKNKKQVEDTMKEALAVDKTRSQVFEIGPLGLMQVTRKRVSGGLVESFSETCPTCEGRGIIINYDA